MKKFEQQQADYWAGKKERRYPTHSAIRQFAIPKIKKIFEVTGLSSDARILDVGCGNGYFTYYFAKTNPTVGIDNSETMLQQNPNKDLVLGSAADLPFKDDSFDLVFCSNLLHHLEDPLNALQEMKRVSRKFVAVSEPNSLNPGMFLFEIIVEEERAALKFHLGHLKQLFGKSGLKLLYAKNMGSIVPNKTPAFLVPILKPLDVEHPLGFYSLCIGKK